MDLDGNGTHLYLMGFLLVYQKQKKPHPQPSIINTVFQLLTSCDINNKINCFITSNVQKLKHGMQVIHSGSQQMQDNKSSLNIIHLCHILKYKTKNIFMLFLFLLNNFKIFYTWMKSRLSPLYYCHLVLSFVCRMFFSNGPW